MQKMADDRRKAGIGCHLEITKRERKNERENGCNKISRKRKKEEKEKKNSDKGKKKDEEKRRESQP